MWFFLAWWHLGTTETGIMVMVMFTITKGFPNLYSFKSYSEMLRQVYYRMVRGKTHCITERESLRQLGEGHSHHQINWNRIIARCICTSRNSDPHIIAQFWNSTWISYLSLVCSSYFQNSERISYFCNDTIYFLIANWWLFLYSTDNTYPDYVAQEIKELA